MANEINRGPSVGGNIGTGIGQLLQGLAGGANKYAQGQMFQQQGLPSQLAYMDPSTQAALIKQQGSGINPQQLSGIGGTLQNLQDLQQRDNIDRGFFWGGGDKDTYDLYAKELEKKLSKVYPDAVVPTSKMDKQARQEGLMRLNQRLQNDFGMGIDSLMGNSQGPQQQPNQQMMPQQQEQAAQDESSLAALFRNLISGGAQAAGPLVNLAGNAAGVSGAGAPIIASDIANAAQGLREAQLPSADQIEDIASRLPEGLRERYKESYRQATEPGILEKFVPSTKNIKSVIGKLLPDNYFEPNSRNEQVAQDLIGKSLSLYSLGDLGLARSAVSAGTGLAAREVARDMGYGPLAQTTAELLFTMAPNVLYGPARSRLAQQAEKGFEKFQAPENLSREIEVPNLIKEANDIHKKAGQYLGVPSNKRIYKAIENFADKGFGRKGDSMRLGDAITARRQLNKFIGEADLSKADYRELTNFTRNLGEKIVSEGKRLKISGAQDFEKANQIWHGLKASEPLVSSLIESAKRGNLKSSLMRNLFSHSGAGTAIGLGTKVMKGVTYPQAALAGLVGGEIVQFYKFMNKTPGAWNELAKAAKDSLIGNAKAAAGRLDRLDNKAQKWEKKNNISQRERTSRGI